MMAYFLRSDDPTGGYFDLYRTEPDMETERLTVQEVRKGDFSTSKWLSIQFGEVPVDPETYLDAVIQPFWDAATVIWTREGGYVG